MIIENEYGRVDFDVDFSKHKKIGISFSGGCDSTLMLYFLLTMVEEDDVDVQIIPVTGINLEKGKWKLLRSQEILDHLLSEFPNAARKVGERLVHYNYTQREYGTHVEDLARDGVIDIQLYALTKNPPIEVMEKHDLMRRREVSRDDFMDVDNLCRDTAEGPCYDVFRNIDKRWVAQCYHDYGLMEHIYPLTASCERLRTTPDMLHNEEPCGHCWWCREKKMAFGSYDGGVTEIKGR